MKNWIKKKGEIKKREKREKEERDGRERRKRETDPFSPPRERFIKRPQFLLAPPVGT